MQLQVIDSNGPAPAEGPLQGPEKPWQEFKQHSSSLPFGQSVSLPEIGGPTYLTAQTLVQQVAYSLSDRLWSYSPDTFDLDSAVQEWHAASAQNAYGYMTNVKQMDVRAGAASVALGYTFSKDFDIRKRFFPQSILASSSCLQYLRSALDQLSRLYSLSAPFVAHIAAIDYVGKPSKGLVVDYVSALTIAEEMDLGVVSSSSVHEAQHMALYATLLSSIVPTIHIYDGVYTSRETTRVIDVLDQPGLYNTYKALLSETSGPSAKRASLDRKTGQLLKAFNDELGTTYDLFEFQGHAIPDAVLVVFGTVESSLASQVALSLERDGAKVAVVNVRVYRPFIEESFLKTLPQSTKVIGVLGQVQDRHAVSDSTIRSSLHNDVLAAITFSNKWPATPAVIDIKYSREHVWTPISIAASFQLLIEKPLLDSQEEGRLGEQNSNLQLIDLTTVQQYTFWDLGDSLSASAPAVLGKALSKESANNVVVKTSHDNLLQGGIIRTDIRKSKQILEAPYSIDSADVVFISDLTIINHIDVIKSLRLGGKVIMRLPGVKDDDLEKKLPTGFRKALSIKAGHLIILDPQAIDFVSNDPESETFLTQAAFLRVAVPSLESVGLQKLASINGSEKVFEDVAQHLDEALRQIEVPESWASEEVDETIPALPSDIRANGFSAVSKIDPEPPTFLKSWQTAAKGFAFKEAFGTSSALRPDLSVKTFTVHVQENRRLTPLSYDRNIFHIEFNLGDSGLKYEIGEALGIHAENDEKEVQDFIHFYKLNPEEIVEVPSREDPKFLENRTVYQALMQNVDIFGRPPKRFYEALAEFADDPSEKKTLLSISGLEGNNEFKRRAEVDTVTYADVLLEFPSAHPSFHDIVRIVNPMKRREYSVASCQKVTPTSIALMVVVVNWVDPQGRDRFGQATRYLAKLHPGSPVTVSVKPSVMKLPPLSTQPLIMAGLGTGLAPFRAFVQHRAWEKEQGKDIGAVLLYMGSRHQREEYCYGEEWEAYQDAGIITLLGRAFSRDQPQKIYIQDRMRETMPEITQAYLRQEGAFYLCGPTWPVPDVTNVLEDAIAREGKAGTKKVDPRKEIERLKDEGRYVLEVY
ncbi:hypothetical protein MMC20_000797 [Loxospora ochrophaea]|nr:hypothetical protein [Loxospora ochrophaea]